MRITSTTVSNSPPPLLELGGDGDLMTLLILELRSSLIRNGYYETFTQYLR
jgi:hypothetical protein